MDFISTILATLKAGGQITTSEAIKDAHKALKRLLLKNITDKQNEQNVQLILSKYEEKPEVWKEPLRDELIQMHADQGKEIVRAVQILLELLTQEMETKDTFVIHNTGTMQGVVQGDYNTNTFTIGGGSDKDI